MEDKNNNINKSDVYTPNYLIHSLDRQVRGYECPKFYIDPVKSIQMKKWRELEDSVIQRKAIFPDFKKYDKEGNLKMPIRKTLFDEAAVKNVYHRNDVNEKHPELVEKFKEMDAKSESLRNSSALKHAGFALYKADRKTLIEEYMNRANNDLKNLAEHKQSAIDAVIEKKKNDPPEQSYLEKMKVKYSAQRCGWTKGDRITYLDDANHVGEKSCFYNTKPEEDVPEKEKKLFYPNKDKVLKSSPKYSFNKIIDKADLNEKKSAISSQIEEKQNNLKEKWSGKNIQFFDSIRESTEALNRRGKYYIQLKPNNPPSEQLIEYRSKKKSPSPDKYFMIKKEIFPHNKHMKRSEVSEEEEKRFVDMNKIKKFVYKPMNKAVY